MDERPLIFPALRLLGVDHLVLSLQDVSFPATPDKDLGRGSPYSLAAMGFLEVVRDLGFTGLQLGPQGLQEEGSASPYEATAFSRNPLNLEPVALCEQGLLAMGELEAVLAARPPGTAHHADHRFAFRAAHRLLEIAGARALATLPVRDEAERFRREHAAWLEPDALYEVLCEQHQNGDWRTWAGPEAALDRTLFSPPPVDTTRAQRRRETLIAAHAKRIHHYAFEQWLLHRQHARFRANLRALGLASQGDLQVGLSARDEWAQLGLMLAHYRLGAPPSRTNPAGQPWNYPVLDPDHYRSGGGEGAALSFVRARVRKLLDEHDGLRIDHPHGLVCPWVYRDDNPDPIEAVQHGARLFSSPDLLDHAALAPYAIARADQLDPGEPRFSDDRVSWLSDEQVDRYAILMDAVMDEAARRGARGNVLGEVLSTMPYPLRRVFERHGLGRFRVTQKANLHHPSDVYRSENAAPSDWIMLGSHDTPPIWRVIPRWRELGTVKEHATYLAGKLEPDPGQRERVALQWCERDGALAEAMLADALACPARNVQIFFADLFGLDEVFNTPGTISPQNWRLRVPPDYARVYPLDRRARRALNLPGALALALRSRGRALVRAQRDLIEALEARANASD